MNRSIDDDETIHKRSAWLIPLGVFVITFALSAVFLLLYLAPNAPGLFEEQVSPTSRSDIIHLRVHGRAFYIPADYLEYASTRQGGDRHEVALFALLPDMTGWSNWEAQTFAGNAPDSPVVFLLIRDEKINLSEADRLRRVYLGYVTDPRGEAGPYGLREFTFRQDSGYHDEDLYVGETAKGPVVLRCVRLGPEVPSPSCLRDLLIAPGVSLSYRFKRAHLAKWREIGDNVDKLISSFEKLPAKASYRLP
jgi:hypothetical protein